jgi:FkbM family methyltransferase
MSTNPNSLLSAKKLKEIFSNRFGSIFNSPYRKFDLNWFQVKKYKHAGKNKDYAHKLTNNLTVQFNDPQAFLLSVRELFIEEIYKFRPTTPTPKIIDCGAHIGMSVLFFKLNYPGAQITAYEPDSGNYAIAKKNIDSWNFQDVDLVQKAIWTNNDHIQFQQLNDMGSNIVQNDVADETNSNVRKVDCVRLNDLLKNGADFVKLDIEGAEYEVIKDCRENLSKVKNLFIEYHGNYDEMHKLSTILSIVTELKFSYYIKEAGNIYQRPFYDKERNYSYDVQLNIFCFKDN